MWEYLARKIGTRRPRGESADIHPPAPPAQAGQTGAISPHGEKKEGAGQTLSSRILYHRKSGRELKCPVCNIAMKIRYYGKVEVDQCPNCGGVFLDGGELKALGADNRSSYEEGEEREDNYLIYTPHGLSSHIKDHGPHQ